MQGYEKTDIEYNYYNSYSYIGEKVNGVSEYVSDSEYREALNDAD